MIELAVIVVLIIVVVKVSKWATKDIAGQEPSEKEFHPDNVYHNNYKQGK